MHRLLKRQLRKEGLTGFQDDERFVSFIDSVNSAYIDFDNDYLQLERTLELSAKESFRELSNFKEALNNAAIVTISDYHRKILFVNNLFLTKTGFTKAEIIGADHRLVNSDYHPESFYQQIWKQISNGKIWKGEMKCLRKDGSEFWVNDTIVPLLNRAGAPIRFLTIMNDITREKAAEEAIREYAQNLEDKNKELDQFAYVVSHDLKAPLRAINNLSEWIEEDLGDLVNGDTRNNIDLLRGRVHRMENLINGILDYSRVGRKKVKKQDVDTRIMINELLELICTGNNVEFSCNDKMPIMFTEKLLLEQVFSNLISNAIKYNDKDITKIRVSHSMNKGLHVFGVNDNGPGIEKEYQENIFVIFQTLQPRDKVESTGVGLAIVKKIVLEKGGNIWVESNNGDGTTFYFTWPDG